ncbi:uncharacterized protein LOC129601151 [Paramacrobiotus metropolitanus]|uniref:uncharacterized protein LOC129601151 n=1 Tax=Paramacrobiotus metropolitanus TaxID=2943436 RepID=UPI002446271A|nr:uncharacterized protein LOC129601151 [Paramacrobiotus metropolitanus]
MTPACWDINVVMHFRGRRLFVLATQDISNCTGLQDEAEINPLKCVTVGCSSRIPSDSRASQPCRECGAINTDRLLQFRRFTEHLEMIRNSEDSGNGESLETAFFKKLDAADILHGDAYLRFLCGWNVMEKHFKESRFDDGWKLVPELIVCLRNICPRYHMLRAFHLSSAAGSAASALPHHVETGLSCFSKPAQRQMKAMSVGVLKMVAEYGKEAEQIFRAVGGDESKEARYGQKILSLIDEAARSIKKIFRNNKI